MFHTYVKASSGNEVDIDRARFLMDLALFDTALMKIGAQKVWNEYCRLHLEKYGEPFGPDVNPNWDQ